MINENIVGKCFRSSSSLTNPRISPLTIKCEYHQLSLSVIIEALKTNKYSDDQCKLFHANVLGAYACSKHSNFLKVNCMNRTHSTIKCRCIAHKMQRANNYSPSGWTDYPQQKLNYEHFNRSNFNIHYWSWNYRGCWHQTCPPIGTRKGI